MTDFWQLPGPARFVQDVTEDLRAGQNVVLVFPEHAPDGWLPSLRNRLRMLNLPTLKEVQTNGRPPVNEILGHCGIEPPTRRLRPAELCSVSAFSGRFLYVRGDAVAAWPSWREFLVEYDHEITG